MQSRKQNQLSFASLRLPSHLCVKPFLKQEAEPNERSSAERKHQSRTRSTLYQHHSCVVARRRAKSKLRPSRTATRRGADGLRALDAFSATQSAQSKVGKSR